MPQLPDRSSDARRDALDDVTDSAPADGPRRATDGAPPPDASPPASPPPDPAELRGLRFLRVLVTVLTAVMIVGIVALVILMARGLNRVGEAPAPLPALPDTLELPEGATAQAVTAGPGWWAVVTQAGDILIYDAAGALARRIPAPELAAP